MNKLYKLYYYLLLNHQEQEDANGINDQIQHESYYQIGI